MNRVALIGVAFLLTACGGDKSQNVVTKDSAEAAVTQPVSVQSVEWPLHGNDWGEQRHSPLTQINLNTVKDLGLHWSFDMKNKRGVEATPLMVDGTLYVTASWSVVHALDAKTGVEKWSYDPKVDRAFLAKGCCDAVNRGVAYANGKVIVGAYDGRLIALNAEDGSVAWDVQTTDRSQPYTITGAPRIAGGKVIIGNGGAELGVRGYVTAYDIDSGAQAWRFYTVPGNPADGFENELMEQAAATWTGEWWEWGGGGTVWDSMVYDPELDLFYIGVGNGSPWNQAVRSPEGGDNLFLTSIVALRPATGEYVWHYQTTPGETWDFTATQHMLLADLEIDGKTRKVLMQAPKNGFFYVLDRETGELISAENYTEVNWATHVDPATGRPVETKDARVFDGKRPSLPSNAGGHNWPAMSYHPGTGLVYIPTMVFPVAFLAPANDRDRLPKQGKWNVGFDRIANAPPEIPEQDLAAALDKEFSGQLLAWDPVKQESRWKGEIGRPNVGGILSTAGDLVFQPDGHGILRAFNAATGEELWSHDTQTGAMAPAISYAIDGEQYIAIAVGFGGGLVAEAGGVAHAWKIPNLSRVLVYKLGGKHTLPPVTITEQTLPEPAAVTANADELEHGRVVYHRHCSYCHGDGLRTGGATKDLRWSPLASVPAAWQSVVIDGVMSGAGMVSFKDYVSANDAEAIRQYVLKEANRLYKAQQ